jgi:hypothetical protein
MSEQAEQVYHAFLIRCWLIPPLTTSEPPTWRFELREVSTDPQKHRFSSLKQLKKFLAAKLVSAARGSQAGGEEEGLEGEEP